MPTLNLWPSNLPPGSIIILRSDRRVTFIGEVDQTGSKAIYIWDNTATDIGESVEVRYWNGSREHPAQVLPPDDTLALTLKFLAGIGAPTSAIERALQGEFA